MDSIFPFGLPAPTAFYLTLYVLTFALHQAFVHYVLAGSLYVAWMAVRPGRGSVSRADQPLAATLRDWMPFVLSAAITAGVAPLLFVQIVYQPQFYTANLLLWWRWMVVVPVLIVAFYLLYLLKSSILSRWPAWIRPAVAVGTAGCFIFVGFCWTANHLIGNSEVQWPGVYATGRLPLAARMVIPRMLVWIGGSFATMSVIAGWQLRYQRSRRESPFDAVEASRLAVLALGGLVMASIASIVYAIQLDGPSRQMLLGSAALPYVVLTVVGLLIQSVAWSLQWQSQRLSGPWLTMASVGAAFGLLGLSVARESLRISGLNLTRLTARHAEATDVGGFGVFVASAILVAGLIGWCLWLVSHGWIPRDTPPNTKAARLR